MNKWVKQNNAVITMSSMCASVHKRHKLVAHEENYQKEISKQNSQEFTKDEKIVNNILNSTIEEHSDIVAFCGDSNGIKKRYITDCTTKLLKFSHERKCKIILCAFPYASNMSYDSYDINLNLYMHHLTGHHNDVFLFFDCNKFVTKFTLTQDTVYLSNSFKKRIAHLLAYNLSHSVHDDRTSTRQDFSRTNMTINLN
jgi:hypothetical protein